MAMRALIVEDDFASRRIMMKILEPHADVDVAVNGLEALEAFRMALLTGSPYSLICMDLMMPHMDGIETMTKLRGIETEYNVPQGKAVNIIITTAVNDSNFVKKAVESGKAAACIIKPIEKKRVIAELQKLGLISN